MTEQRSRQLLGIGVPAAALALLVVPYLAVRSNLPDRVATHFDASGTPDGSMTPGTFVLLLLVMGGLGVAGSGWLAWSRKPLDAFLAPGIGFLSGFFVGLAGGISVVTFVSQRGLERWEEADQLWALILIPLLLAVVGGALIARVATHLPAKALVLSAGGQPVLDLARGEHAVWSDTLHSPWLFRLGIFLPCLGVVLAAVTVWVAAIPSLLIGLLITSLATLRVRADRNGLQVKYGMLPWPTTTVDIDQVATASVIDVRPMEWGGWGYRGSLKLMKRAAVVHRAGPGIRLDLRNDNVFVVTVDNPEMPVALLNAEIARTKVS